MEHSGGRELTAQDYGNNTLEDMYLHRLRETMKVMHSYMSEVENVKGRRRICP